MTDILPTNCIFSLFVRIGKNVISYYHNVCKRTVQLNGQPNQTKKRYCKVENESFYFWDGPWELFSLLFFFIPFIGVLICLILLNFQSSTVFIPIRIIMLPSSWKEHPSSVWSLDYNHTTILSWRPSSNHYVFWDM